MSSGHMVTFRDMADIQEEMAKYQRDVFHVGVSDDEDSGCYCVWLVYQGKYVMLCFWQDPPYDPDTAKQHRELKKTVKVYSLDTPISCMARILPIELFIKVIRFYK